MPLATTSLRPDVSHIVNLVPDNAHFIGGQWLPAQNGESIDVLDPSTQRPQAGWARL